MPILRSEGCARNLKYETKFQDHAELQKILMPLPYPPQIKNVSILFEK